MSGLRSQHATVESETRFQGCAVLDLGRHSNNMPIKGASGGDADDVIRAALWVARPSDSWHKQFPSRGNDTNVRGVSHLTNSHPKSLVSCTTVITDRVTRAPLWFNEQK